MLLEKSLAATHPELSKEWNNSKNNHKPKDVSFGSNKKVWWLCEKGHSWEDSPNHRANSKRGCPYCSGRRVSDKNSLTINYPELIKEWDYSKNTLKPEDVSFGAHKKVWWVCNEGHSWEAVTKSRAFGKQGCPYCSGKCVSEKNSLVLNHPELIKEWDYCKNIHKPEEVSFGSGKKVWWLCDKGHSWNATPKDRTRTLGSTNCPHCCNTHTNLEKFLEQALSLPRFNQTMQLGNKKYRPDIKLSDTIYLNADGLYWHNEVNRPRNYHFKLREDFENNNLRIVQFYDDEIYNKTEIVKSIINAVTGKIINKIFARKCKLTTPTQEQADEFFEANHLIGKVAYSKFIGLEYDNKIVSVLAYRKEKDIINITRFAGVINTVIVGGFQKLLKQLVNLKAKQIETLIDLRYANGHSLEKAGFKKTGVSINYEYTDGITREDKRKFRVPAGTNEVEAAEARGWYRIWNAGRAKFTLIP